MIDAAHPPCESARVPDWNDLRYFLAIARSGSLAGAGRELGVEHTTVGRRLAALEKELGTGYFSAAPTDWSRPRRDAGSCRWPKRSRLVSTPSSYG